LVTCQTREVGILARHENSLRRNRGEFQRPPQGDFRAPPARKSDDTAEKVQSAGEAISSLILRMGRRPVWVAIPGGPNIRRLFTAHRPRMRYTSTDCYPPLSCVDMHDQSDGNRFVPTKDPQRARTNEWDSVLSGARARSTAAPSASFQSVARPVGQRVAKRIPRALGWHGPRALRISGSSPVRGYWRVSYALPANVAELEITLGVLLRFCRANCPPSSSA